MLLALDRHATLACYKALVKKNPKVSLDILRRSPPVAEGFVQANPPLGSDRVNAAPGSSLYDVSLSILQSQAKIALKASSEEEILELEAIAKSLNLCARSIQDA